MDTVVVILPLDLAVLVTVVLPDFVLVVREVVPLLLKRTVVVVFAIIFLSNWRKINCGERLKKCGRASLTVQKEPTDPMYTIAR